MIDKQTGALHFDDHKGALHPGLTREAFLKSDLARGATVSVKNEPHCSWKLKAVRFLDRDFLATAYFRGEKLNMISLAENDPRFGGDSWDDWSEAKEQARKKSHDSLLSKVLGRSRKFPWGEVSPSYDPRSAGSSITVSYGEGPP